MFLRSVPSDESNFVDVERVRFEDSDGANDFKSFWTLKGKFLIKVEIQ
jgi:hypothetical protein